MSLPVTRTFSGVTGNIPTADETQWAYNQSASIAWTVANNGGMQYVHVADHTVDNMMRWTGDTFADSHFSQVTMGVISTNGTGVGRGFGPACRLKTTDTTKTGYRAVGDSHGWEFGRCDNPAFTSLATGSTGADIFVAGDTFKMAVIRSGSNDLVYLWRNSVLLGASPYTVTSPLTGGAAGVAHSSSTTSTGAPVSGIDSVILGNYSFILDSTSGIFALSGFSTVLRPGSNTYLRYRK